MRGWLTLWGGEMTAEEEPNKFILTEAFLKKLNSFGVNFNFKDDVFTKRRNVLAVLPKILDPDKTTVSTDLSTLDPEVFRALIAYALHDKTTADSIMVPIIDKILSIINLEVEQITHATEYPQTLHIPALSEILEDLPEPYIDDHLVQGILDDLTQLNSIAVGNTLRELSESEGH